MIQQQMTKTAYQAIKAYPTNKPMFNIAPVYVDFANNGIIKADNGQNRRLLLDNDIYHMK